MAVKNRIWELDALRGLCILCMVVIHAVYDMVELYALIDWEYPQLYMFVQRWGGVIFLLISGICVTLGKHPVRRGLLVFGCGLIVSLVTASMYWLHLAGKSMIIYFGVLHCLGVCMLLWYPLRKCKAWLLAVLGAGLAALGLWIMTFGPVGTSLLIPFGFMPAGFATSDYFPLLPHFGFFLLGAALGKTLYRRRESLIPRLGENPVSRFFCRCGKWSLWIYLLHQPILSGIFYLVLLWK